MSNAVPDSSSFDINLPNLPSEVWLMKVAPFLGPKKLCVLLTLNREMLNMRKNYLKPGDLERAAKAWENPSRGKKIKKVKNMEKFSKIDKVYHPGIDFSVSRWKGVKVDMNSWTDEELEMAKNAYRVTIESKDIDGLTRLKEFKSVRLNYVEKTVDLSIFASIPKLHFDYCDQMTDVSALGKVPDLTIAMCFNVEDFSALGQEGQKSLTIQCSDHLTDVSPFANVHTLNLSYCENISEVGSLTGVHTLNLLHCTKVTDVSMLASLSKLITSEKDKKCVLNVDILVQAGVEIERRKCGGCL